MKSVAIFSDDNVLRDLVNQLEDYQVAYFSTELDRANLPNDIDLGIFDFDIVPLSLLDEWSQFPRLHLPKLAVVSSDNLAEIEDVLDLLDNYIVRPFSLNRLGLSIDLVIRIGREIGEFGALFQYELRTRLEVIKGYSQIIRSSHEEHIEQQQRKLTKFATPIFDNAEKAKQILLIASDWEHIEYRKQYNFTKLEMSKLLVSANQFVEKQLEQKSQVLNVWIPDNLPLISVDESKTLFLLTTLLDNASKYSAKNTHIDVRVTPDHRYIVCLVEDRGIGVSEYSYDHLFDKYYRGDNPAVYEQYGLGLSLYLSKQIIEMHGGKIWFESEEGVGTTFYFTLPLAE